MTNEIIPTHAAPKGIIPQQQGHPDLYASVTLFTLGSKQSRYINPFVMTGDATKNQM